MIKESVIEKHKYLLQQPVNFKITKFFNDAYNEGNSPIAVISNTNTIFLKNCGLKCFSGDKSSEPFYITLNLSVFKNVKDIIQSFYCQLNDRVNLSTRKIKAKEDHQIPIYLENLYDWLSDQASSEYEDTFIIQLTIQCNLISNDYHKTLLKDFFHCLFKSQNHTLGKNLYFHVIISCGIFDFRTTNHHHNDIEAQPTSQISSALLDILEPNNFDENPPSFVSRLFSYPTKSTCFNSFINISCIDYGNCLIQPGPSLIKILKRYFFTNVQGVDVLWRLFEYFSLKQKQRYFIFVEDVQMEPNNFIIGFNNFLEKVNEQANNLLVEKITKQKSDENGKSETKTDFKKKLRIRNDGKFGKKDQTNQLAKAFPLDSIRAFMPSFKSYVNTLQDSSIKKKLLTDDTTFIKFLVECNANIINYRACLGPCLEILCLFCKTFSHNSSQEEMEKAYLYCQVLQGNIKKCPIVSKSLATLLSSPHPSSSSLTLFIAGCHEILSNASGSLNAILNDVDGPLSKLHQILHEPSAQSFKDPDGDILHKASENVEIIEKLINVLLSDYLFPPNTLLCHELYYLENDIKDEDLIVRELYPSPAIDMTKSFNDLLIYFQRENYNDGIASVELVYAATAYQIAITEKSTSFYTRKIKLLDWFEAFQESIHSNYLGKTETCPDLMEAFKQALLDLRYMGLAKPRKRVKNNENSRYWDVTIVNFA